MPSSPNSEALICYGECDFDQYLVATLKPRNIVVMDNLPAHKNAESDTSSGPLARRRAEALQA